jgi:hypothetical protein
MGQGVGKNHERDVKRIRCSVRKIIVGRLSSASAFDIIHPSLVEPLLTPPFVAVAFQLSSFHNNLRDWQTIDSLDDGRTPVVKLANDSATLDCSLWTIYSLDDPELSSSLIFFHHLLLLAFQSYLSTNPWLLARG